MIAQLDRLGRDFVGLAGAARGFDVIALLDLHGVEWRKACGQLQAIRLTRVGGRLTGEWEPVPTEFGAAMIWLGY